MVSKGIPVLAGGTGTHEGGKKEEGNSFSRSGRACRDVAFLLLTAVQNDPTSRL